MWIWIMGTAVAIVLFVLLAICYLFQLVFGRQPVNAVEGQNMPKWYVGSPHHKAVQAGFPLMESLPCEDVTITACDGLQLHARLYPAEKPSRKFVLGIHGYRSFARSEYAPHIAFYRSLGYNMLLPDDRGHGQSQGDFITFGNTDRLDCVKWAQYLVQRFGPDVQILLHGVSMGGATVLSASAEPELPKQVFGVVSDCGFSCVRDAFAFQLKAMYHVESDFPVKVCQWYAKHKAGFDFTEARPIDRVKEARVPIFFVQGAEDCLVPKEMAEQLYMACTAPKKLLIVEHASHAESIALDPEGYHQAMRELFGI